jgi:hypothetical protein
VLILKTAFISVNEVYFRLSIVKLIIVLQGELLVCTAHVVLMQLRVLKLTLSNTGIVLFSKVQCMAMFDNSTSKRMQKEIFL